MCVGTHTAVEYLINKRNFKAVEYRQPLLLQFVIAERIKHHKL